MEHAQKAIEEFHNRRSKGNVLCDEDINFLLVGEEIAQMYHIKFLMK
jgi:hypothetical protein